MEIENEILLHSSLLLSFLPFSFSLGDLLFLPIGNEIVLTSSMILGGLELSDDLLKFLLDFAEKLLNRPNSLEGNTGTR